MKYAGFETHIKNNATRVTPFFDSVSEVTAYIKENGITYDIIRPVLNWREL